MQYFIFLFWIILALSPLFLFIRKAALFRKNFINNTLTDWFINQDIFSTLTIRELTSYILKQSSTVKKQLLQSVLQKNISHLQKQIKDTSLKNQLRLLTNVTAIADKTDNPLELLLCAHKLIAQNRYHKAISILHRLKERTHSSGLAGLKLLIDAKIALHEGDLLNSSAWCIQAVSLFKKQHMFYEQAQSYFLLSHIYFKSTMSDTAEIAAHQALKIFRNIKHFQGCARALCHLGIITAAQERWTDADKFLNEALEVARKTSNHQLIHTINCYLAQLNLCLNNPHNALSILTSSIRFCNDTELTAFHASIEAQSYFFLKQYNRAHNLAVKAHRLYTLSHNDEAATEITSFIQKIKELS